MRCTDVSCSSPNRGLAAGLSAFALWGFLALFWKLLDEVPALEILCYRIVCSFAVLLPVLLLAGRGREVLAALRDRAALLRLLCSTVLIGVNWFTYIWSVNNGHVLDTSLGYYINPLMNVLAGFLFLRERATRMQGWAIALACVGVLWSVIGHGAFPWLALVLAVTFTAYGFIRKTVAVEALPGLFLETALLTPVALAWIVWLAGRGQGALAHPEASTLGLLALSGPLTSLPLALFAYGARHMRLMTLGIAQYLSPTCSFLLGIFVFRETLSLSSLAAFLFIWGALALYTWESLRLSRPQR